MDQKLNHLNNLTHRLATFEAIDRLMPSDAPESLIGELHNALVETRRQMHHARNAINAALVSAAR